MQYEPFCHTLPRLSHNFFLYNKVFVFEIHKISSSSFAPNKSPARKAQSPSILQASTSLLLSQNLLFSLREKSFSLEFIKLRKCLN